MKIDFKEILFKNNKNIFNKKAYLIYGNEETLINKIEEILISLLKETNFNEVVRKEGVSISNNFENLEPSSLFNSSKIYVFKNPKEVSMQAIEKINLGQSVVIINHITLKASSKLKSEIESHKDFAGIPCYKINKDTKKLIVDSYMTEYKIELEKEAYWFLLDNLSNVFGLLDSELRKISNYTTKKISLQEVRLLLSNYENSDEIEDLFLDNNSYRAIINKSQKLINSSADLYLLIQRIKFYLYIFFDSKNTSELERNVPRYLFAKKQKLKSLYVKFNRSKFVTTLELLKKTEILLRKNEKMYLPISQRFLLNIKKSIN